MTRRRRVLARLLPAAFAGLLAACVEQDTTLTIRPDGTCVVRLEYRAERSRVITHLEMMQENLPAARRPPKPYKAMNDDELAAALRKAYMEMDSDTAKHKHVKLESVTVREGAARAVIAATLGSLKDLVSHASDMGEFPGIRRMIVEKDGDGHLRLTLHSWGRGADKAVAAFKERGIGGSFRLVLPGKVLTSSFPNIRDNATWVTADGKRPETLKALAKLLAEPVVVTAELGGLKLDERLDSHVPPYATTLPTVEAGPDALVHPIAVTTVRYGFLGDHRKLIEANKRALDEATGVTIEAKLSAPKGRFLISVERLRVLEARDDKGRQIRPGRPHEPPTHVRRMGPLVKPAAATLRLALPARDARAIRALKGEAVVLTGSGWKEMILPNPRAERRKKIDLSRLLPGATMVVNSLDSMPWHKRGLPQGMVNRRWSVGLSLKGPERICQLDVSLRFPGDHEPARLAPRLGGEVLRGGHEWICSPVYRLDRVERQRQAKPGNPSLILRVPQTVRRERLGFTIHNIPLFEPPPARTIF